MKRLVLSMLLGGSLLVPAIARADDDAPRRPTAIWVHVDSSKAVTVQRHADGDWIDVCESPCDRAVPADGEYRIGGSDVRPSHTFSLDRDARRIDLKVDAGSRTQRDGGIALAILGGIGTLTGVVMLVVGSFQATVPTVSATEAPVIGVLFSPSSTTIGPNHDLMTAGGITLGAGVFAAVLGITLAATATTQVVQHARPATLADADVAPRAPTWRERAAGPAEVGRPTLVPIFSGTF